VSALPRMNGGGADLRIVTEIRGAPAKLFSHTTGGEVIISGPAGTGKTRAILEWIHRRCATEKGLRVLMLRKTLESLKASGLITYTTQVLYQFDGKKSDADGVTYYGGSTIRPADFTYQDTGSKIVVAGMDRLSKVLSTEWDVVYVNEITELTLPEYEQLSARIDRPQMDDAKPPSLLLGDCNPDAPTHWIKQRERDGKLLLWSSRHEHNPAMWDKRAKVWTPSGERYIERLDRLTGVRYQRLRLGKWVAAEGQVYEGWNPDLHLIPRFDIPADWPRFWVVDFGFVHPFVWQAWAQGPDGALYRYREIYMTRRLVEDHAAVILQLTTNEPKPRAVITDHDAEDRATFDKHARVRTVPAKKSISDGIQAVAARLRPEANGRPHLFFLRDSLVERDRELVDLAQPTCTEEEFPSYVWPEGKVGPQRKVDEVPVKEFDHGMDATRYLVAHFDLQKRLATARSF
jgi:phage terminase large subunit